MSGALAAGRSRLALLPAIVLLAGCVLPLLLLIVLSVFEVEDFELVPAFSGRAWREILTSPAHGWLIAKAVLLGLLTAFLTALLGLPVALALAALPRALEGPALVVLLTPLYTGEIVRIYAWRIVLGAEGLVNALLRGAGLVDEPVAWLLFSPVATAIVLAYNNLPFMVLCLWVARRTIDPRILEAARDLGARPVQVLAPVTVPLLAPGLAAGGFAVFALAAGDMLTPSLLGGTSGATAMAMIDNLFGTAFDWPAAAALALALLGALLVAGLALARALLGLGGPALRPAGPGR